ncbi:MAG: hypothetical protein GXY19_02045 [Phycisphaerae bacterium]|nr:hypothetical protein [Phycisphaerae bacterium]
MVLGVAVYLLASVTFAGTVELENGIPVVDISGAAGSEQFYTIVVPEGQLDLVIGISGGSGDCDLYVRREAKPTTTAYDHRPYKIGNEESVTVGSPQAGTWHIMLRGFTHYSGLTLESTYSCGAVARVLTNGAPVTGLSGAVGSEQFYQFVVPANRSQLQISISGGTGDCDLYVRKDAMPTTDVYDYRPFLVGNRESVVVNNPGAGTWYIMLKGCDAYADVTLLGLAAQPSSGEPAHSAITIADSSDLIIDGDISHLYPMDRSIDTGLWPDIAAEGPVGGKEASVSATHEMVWTTLDYYTDPQATITANFTVSLDLSSGNAGNWSSAEYWIKLELVGQYGTLIDCGEVRSGTITVVDGAGLSDSKTVSVSVTTPPRLVDYTNCAVLRLTAGATAEALTASLSDDGPDDGAIVLTEGVSLGGLAGAAGSETCYRIEVPTGQTRLQISTSGGTGDVDLYVRRNAKPTTREWDYRPYLIGNNETVTVDNPKSGTYYILLRGAERYSGTTLRAFFGEAKQEDR